MKSKLSSRSTGLRTVGTLRNATDWNSCGGVIEEWNSEWPVGDPLTFRAPALFESRADAGGARVYRRYEPSVREARP